MIFMQQPQQIKDMVLGVSEIIDETATVKSFKMELPANSEINFYPGQFFMVSFPNDPEIKTARAYSIASSPQQKKYLEIALNKVGPFTAKMFELKPGDQLKFKGPYGKFYFSEEMKNSLVLIGGGVGITPLIGIIRHCTDKKLGNKIKLIYSVKTADEIIYKNELEGLKAANQNFDYVVTVTKDEENQNWKGERGRIDIILLGENVENAPENIYFLCGSNEFVHDIIGLLEAIGVKRDQMKTDVWG